MKVVAEPFSAMATDRYATHFRPVLIRDIELTRPPQPCEAVRKYGSVRATVRVRSVPVGEVTLPLAGVFDETAVRRAAIDRLTWPLVRTLMRRVVGTTRYRPRTADDLLAAALSSHEPSPSSLPTVTVAICTRDRAGDLARALEAVEALDPRPDEILVVDNTPGNTATRDVVRQHARVRYVCERRPGLDWARNRAIREATSEVVAFTDDDAIVDSSWVGALKRTFADYPEAMAVTGLVLPYELETAAQIQFEEYGGFGRGFERRVFRVDQAHGERAVAQHGGTGKFGTGANMAFRKAVFSEIGPFDPALDVGTATNGGGDLDIFLRVLRSGHTLVYEPSALVRHRHRRERADLVRQIANNGIGFYSYLVRNALAHPEDVGDIWRLAKWWFWHWELKRAALSILQPGRIDRELSFAELKGSLRGLFRYQRARNRAVAIDAAAVHYVAGSNRPKSAPPSPTRMPPAARTACVDLARPIEPIRSAERYRRVCVLVTWDGDPLGTITIDNRYAPVGVARLRDEIASLLGTRVVSRGDATEATAWCELVAALRRRFAWGTGDGFEPLPDDTAVSVVLPTRNRPDDLERCLTTLTTQETPRRVEIIVVDNDPDSGQTAPVVARFPHVRLVREWRRGLSYARNAGILAASGDIIVATDDDVTAPPHWIERLVAPFRDEAVSIVTGNVLPAELETPSQHLFESYGGLGRGFERRRVDSDWFWLFRGAVPTWKLGATANAAFRASIFDDERIGLFDEALGAGMPTGCSEDTYLFYKVLRAGYAIAYEPAAFVWHRHRRDMRSLHRQIYSYAKGHAAYQLTTLARDGDWRALARLLLQLPRIYRRRMEERLTGRSDYTLRCILLEMLGTLVGPFALLRARRIVRRLGPSLRPQPTRKELDVVHVESAVPQNAARQLALALPPQAPRT
jgi:glycosyltransferase involved in cell wall biosynthesis